MGDMQQWVAAQQQPAFRTAQVLRWLYQARAANFDSMTDLPAAFRTALQDQFHLFQANVVAHRIATDETHKLVLEWQDGKSIECVLLQEETRRTACISTQVGCGMGCVFCASGLKGVERNLSVGEILEQLVLLRNLTAPGERLSHIVVMGMGEPLANLDNLLAALEIAVSQKGLGIGARHITISTVGLPAKIRALADAGKQYHLAVSLHAPNDALRNQIVPTNANIGIDAILDAADYFYATTSRQVTYEYVLLGELNDQPADARELARLLRDRKAHVNLIPWNNVVDLPYRRPAPEAQNAFVATLRHAGISVKVRKRKGADIDAACGQLRRKVLENMPQIAAAAQ